MNTGSPPSPTPPYTEAELRGFREDFARQAARYREFYRWFMFRWCFVVVLVCAVFHLFLDGRMRWTGPVVFGVWTFAMMFFRLRAPKRACPACQRPLERSKWVHHCPGCGSGKENWLERWGRFQCQRCQRSLWKDHSDLTSSVRACTHCGVFLDPEGV